MPPITKTSKEKIISAAHSLVKREGLDALNARSLAKEIGTSTQPIFTNYTSMDEIISDLSAEAYKIYRKYIEDTYCENKFPPYKASGIAYTRFAREERELFNLLFMSKQGAKTNGSEFVSYDDIISPMAAGLGIDLETARAMHSEIWIWVHGASTLIASDFIPLDEEKISEMLTTVYSSLREHYTKKSN